MSSVSLGGVAATSAVLTVPGVGLWYAGVELSEAVTLTGAVTLQILDTSWSGFVIAGGSVDGRSAYRVVAGRGGWGRDLAPRAYQNDAGLTVARLVADAAADAGEPAPVDAPTTRLGVHFDRPRLPGSFALNLLTPRAWYARADGVVAFGARPALPASGLPVMRRDPANGIVELGVAESAAGLLPGIATEFGPAADVEIALGEEGIRARLYASSPPSRLLQSYARIFDAVDPTRRFRGVFEYRVVSQTAERLSLQPIRSRADLPDLPRVPVRAGVPGVKARHAPGSQVLVAFIDADPSRPAVVGFDAPDQPGWMPLELDLGGPAPLGVARQTDPVQAGPFSGAITLGSTRVKAVS